MAVDERDFFREATLQICGSLEIEKCLQSCFTYIHKIIPIDFILMHIYDPISGNGKIIAKADINGAEASSINTTYPEAVRKAINERIIKADLRHPVYTPERLGDNEVMKPFSKLVFKSLDTVWMAITPKLMEHLIAGILVGNNTGQKYSQHHMKLFALLNEPFAIAISNYLQHQELLLLKDILVDDNRFLQEELHRQVGEEIVGANFGLKQVMEMVRQVAPLASPVLLLGETGVGKEVIAAAIHNLSPRKNGPLIRVNCGAIPDSLMDSELFGHEKGAFTGALFQKRGRFERAHGGTIFLDEIGELTPGAQIRLLRVIQEKEIERVGGGEVIPVDIRVIAATHRNLEVMLEEGKFREDLYFRLRVFPILIPPLRDRRADIPALIQHFMTRKSREMGLAKIPDIEPGFIDKLSNYHWPGNVRELQNAIERALILSDGKPLRFNDLGESSRKVTSTLPVIGSGDVHGLDELVSRHIIQALEMTGGRVGGEMGAAKLLKMNPSTLRTKMRKLHIPFGRKRQKNLLQQS